MEGGPPGEVRRVRVAAGNKVGGKIFSADHIKEMKKFKKATAQLYYWNSITEPRMKRWVELVKAAEALLGKEALERQPISQ